MFGNAETVRRYGNQAPEKRFRQQAAAAGPVLPIQNLQTGRAQVSPARVAFCHTIPRRRKSKKAVPVGCVFNHPARFRASVSKVQQKFKLSEQLSPDINKPLTMSSREIAELTDKKHLHVLRDIRKIFNELGGLPIFGETSVKDIWNRNQPEYLLSKREVLLLVSGYSVKLRARIIDRWIELEEASASACGGVPALLAGQPEHLLADTGGLNRAPAGKKAFDESANIRLYGSQVLKQHFTVSGSRRTGASQIYFTNRQGASFACPGGFLPYNTAQAEKQKGSTY